MDDETLSTVGGRAIAGLFALSGIGKAVARTPTVDLMRDHAVPFAPAALAVAVAAELAGAACVATETAVAPAIAGLIAYVAVVTAWIPLQDAVRGRGRVPAIALVCNNVAIVCGMVLVLRARSAD